jgi:hypothetical protein
MSDLTNPTKIQIGGTEQYNSGEEALDAMSKLKRIDTSDSFQHQFVDLGGESEPIIQFSSEVENADDQEVVSIRRRNDEENDTSSVQIFLDFPYESLTTFNATLNEILSVITSLTIEHLNITYRVDNEFSSLSIIDNVGGSIDYELRGVRIAHEEFTYIIQRTDKQISVVATLDDEREIDADSNEGFIKEEVDTATKFVGEVCNE